MDDETKEYLVERESGGYGMLFTFEGACEIAKEDSIERSCLMMVRHQYGYVPVMIYHSGHCYKPLDQDDIK